MDGSGIHFSESGMATIVVVLGVCLSLAMFVVFANLLTFQYGQGAIRASLDEGVRAGAAFGGSEAVCEQRIAEVLDDLLGGEWGRRVEFRCAWDDQTVRARAIGTFPGWLPMVPDLGFSLEVSATRELGS